MIATMHKTYEHFMSVPLNGQMMSLFVTYLYVHVIMCAQDKRTTAICKFFCEINESMYICTNSSKGVNCEQ